MKNITDVVNRKIVISAIVAVLVLLASILITFVVFKSLDPLGRKQSAATQVEEDKITAASAKKSGRDAYAKKDYDTAIESYKKAIELYEAASDNSGEIPNIKALLSLAEHESKLPKPIAPPPPASTK